MNTVLTVWKASGSSTWHGISWKPFHLESFKLSAVWNNLTCRATNWEHFQNVFFVISGSLEKLDLSNNTLNMLPAGLFESQRFIREIDLSQNCLSTPPDELFGQLYCEAVWKLHMSLARFPLGATGAKRQWCMNLHDCRDVGAKDALMEFVLQTFAEKNRVQSVASCFCWVFFEFGSQRQSENHLTSFSSDSHAPPPPNLHFPHFNLCRDFSRLRVFFLTNPQLF